MENAGNKSRGWKMPVMKNAGNKSRGWKMPVMENAGTEIDLRSCKRVKQNYNYN